MNSKFLQKDPLILVSGDSVFYQKREIIGDFTKETNHTLLLKEGTVTTIRKTIPSDKNKKNESDYKVYLTDQFPDQDLLATLKSKHTAETQKIAKLQAQRNKKQNKFS